MTTQQTKYLVFESKTDAGKVLTKELNAPAKGQVLIRVSVSSVQSTDLFQLTGEYPGLKFPITTGYDVVGVIAQVGPDVTGFEVGDRVTYMSVTGGHSEYLLGDASRVVKLGADVASVPDSHITALTLSWMTAYQMVHRAGGSGIKTGRSVLVQGGWGATGRAAVVLAVLRGDIVYTTVRSPEQAEAMEKEFGVTKAFCYTDPTYIKQLREATGGQGVHVVLDGAGANSFSDSRKCLRTKGYLVAYGLHASVVNPGKKASLARIVGNVVWMKLTAWQNFQFYSIDTRRKKKPAEWKEDFNVLVGMLRDGKITVKIAGTVNKLEDIPAAHKRLLEGVDGKLMLEFPSAA